MDAPKEEEKQNTRESEGHVRDISEEEFNPKGTLALTMLYFLIITLLWFFMYFVEFAGHGPSILS